MALFKNEAEREIDVLEKLEKRIARREKVEKVYRLIIVGLSVLTVASFSSMLFNKHK